MTLPTLVLIVTELTEGAEEQTLQSVSPYT